MHLYREIAEGDKVGREVIAWQVREIAEHFKTNKFSPVELQYFVQQKMLIIARDHKDNLLVTIDVPGTTGVLLEDDWLVIYGKRLYSVPKYNFDDDFEKVVEPEPEAVPDNSREELEVQRCSRPHCKQKAQFMFEDDARQLPVFRCFQHLAGDICWDALSASEVFKLRKLGE